MRQSGWMAALAGVLAAGTAVAQIPLGPPAGPMIIPNGIVLSRRPISLTGPFPPNGVYGVISAPNYLPFVPAIGPYGTTVIPTNIPLYGAVDSRISVQIIQPAIIIPARPQQVDLSGVDLDVYGPEALQPGWKPGLAKKKADKELAKPKQVEKKIEVAKQAEKPVLEKPKPALEKPPAQKAEEPKPALDEKQQLFDLGVAAFRDGEYGLAALRFRQVIELEPGLARSRFLLAQASFAMGKYKDAVAAIEAGLKLDPDWPTQKFQPRAELYKGMEAELDFQKKLLEATAALNPKNEAFLFLQAYELWFDGKRDEAVAVFQKARPLAANPVFIDSFLKAAAKAPL